METFTGSGLTFDEVVLGRRSARGFKRAPAPKALIRDVIEMAMRAPSRAVVAEHPAVDGVRRLRRHS
jgi:hypothetical protein